MDDKVIIGEKSLPNRVGRKGKIFAHEIGYTTMYLKKNELDFWKYQYKYKYNFFYHLSKIKEMNSILQP